ncbi:MAG: YkgJ family cysteine cluster protein [Nitrospiraceae bacterium]|nr:YkgJ family cysteine cluster protein [Nitrospiraceae bacterium]
MKNIKKALKKSVRERLRFPEDEAHIPWLPMLLEAYSIIDAGVLHAAEDFEKRKNRKLACRKGCGHCCRTHTDIPLYPLELTGIYWLCIGKLEPKSRAALKERIKETMVSGNTEDWQNACVFLNGNSCSIHPVRPIACRQFNVFGKSCAPEEDPFFTRRGDVLTPIQEYTDRAFYLMMPFYGIHDEAQKEKAVKERLLLHTQALNLKKQNWAELLKLMEQFDSSRVS